VLRRLEGSGLVKRIRRGWGIRQIKRTSEWVGDGLVEFELHFLEPVCDVRVVYALHKDRPRVRVIGGRSLGLRIRDWIERLRGCAKDERSVDLNALHALPSARRSHVAEEMIALRKLSLALLMKKFKMRQNRDLENEVDHAGETFLLAVCACPPGPLKVVRALDDISPYIPLRSGFLTSQLHNSNMATGTATAKKIVVCGGNGFLGSRICKAAVARGWDVTSIRYA
jgi:hypothetical protein